jgi:hypothetical protein
MSDERSQSQKKAKSAQPGNMNASFHGVYALVRWRRRHGLPDGRTTFCRNFREREKEYTQALGGDLSPMLATLVEDIVWRIFTSRLVTNTSPSSGSSFAKAKRIRWLMSASSSQTAGARS